MIGLHLGVAGRGVGVGIGPGGVGVAVGRPAVIVPGVGPAGTAPAPAPVTIGLGVADVAARLGGRRPRPARLVRPARSGRPRPADLATAITATQRAVLGMLDPGPATRDRIATLDPSVRTAAVMPAGPTADLMRRDAVVWQHRRFSLTPYGRAVLTATRTPGR